MNTLHVIGAGGVGSWLVPQLTRLKHRITIWDGDTLEEGNLDRQLFDSEQVGMNKAEAMAQIYPGCNIIPDWFYSSHGAAKFGMADYILCCADNHRARRESLIASDNTGATAIIMGNGFTDADAYIYRPSWGDTPVDPRVRYPDIRTSTDGDPIEAAGCTGHIQDASPQLVLANVRAADHGLHLLWFYTNELVKYPNMDTLDLPVENGSSAFEYWTKTYRQIVEEYRSEQREAA